MGMKPIKASSFNKLLSKERNSKWDVVYDPTTASERLDVLPDQKQVNIPGEGGGIAQLNRYSYRQLCKKLGVPAEYLDRCPTDLARINLEHWVGEQKEPFLFRLKDVGEPEPLVRGVLSTRYQPIDDQDAWNAFQGVLKSQGIHEPEFVAYRIGDLWTEAFAALEAVDDAYFGLWMVNSETGHRSLQVFGGFYRQICTNGMFVTFGKEQLFRKVHQGREDYSELLPGAMNEAVLPVLNRMDFYKSLYSDPKKVSKALWERVTRELDKTHVAMLQEAIPDPTKASTWELGQAVSHLANWTKVESNMHDIKQLAGEVLVYGRAA